VRQPEPGIDLTVSRSATTLIARSRFSTAAVLRNKVLKVSSHFEAYFFIQPVAGWNCTVKE
jgi:hypothetical protein